MTEEEKVNRRRNQIGKDKKTDMNKVAVLGTGCSVKEFDPKEFDWSIGVNDIWKYVHTNDIVCLNPRKDFTPDRMKIIDESTPEHFWSQIVNYDYRPDFRKIDILPGYPETHCSLDGFPWKMNKSYCSPFVACQVAYFYYAAHEIHLFGVDMVAHPHLNGDLCGKIKTHFINLKAALKQKNCELIVHGSGILKDI